MDEPVACPAMAEKAAGIAMVAAGVTMMTSL